MLYPRINIDPSVAVTELPSGNIGLLPLDLEQGKPIVINLKQIITNPQNLPQDRSIRVWISEKPGGRSLTEASTITTLTLTALNVTTIKLVATWDEVEEGGSIVTALPGRYWLNVLNLVNEANSFALEMN